MFSTFHRGRTEEGIPSPLTPIERSRVEHEALHAAATKGGLISLRGKEMQAKTSLEEPGRSFVVEGMLKQVSEQATRQAEVIHYYDQGLSKHDTIKAVWKVEERPLYEQAGYEYEQIVSSQKKKA